MQCKVRLWGQGFGMKETGSEVAYHAGGGGGGKSISKGLTWISISVKKEKRAEEKC